jgi:hypothetical protein
VQEAVSASATSSWPREQEDVHGHGSSVAVEVVAATMFDEISLAREVKNGW